MDRTHPVFDDADIGQMIAVFGSETVTQAAANLEAILTHDTKTIALEDSV